MAWFKVDDALHDHRKTRAVRRSHAVKRRDVAPFGLWVLAGSWSSANGTGGFVPLEVVEEWDDDAPELAARLVTAGLWWETEVDGEVGYGFHDWADYAPRPDGIEDASLSGSRGNHVRWHEKRGKVDPSCTFCRPDDRGDIGGDDRPDDDSASGRYREPVPSRPVPTHAIEDDRSDATASFEAFWALYPRKVGRGQARRAWKAATKATPPEQIIAGLREQLPSLAMQRKSDGDFRPHPSTWLNGERWTDDAAAQQRRDNRPEGW